MSGKPRAGRVRRSAQPAHTGSSDAQCNGDARGTNAIDRQIGQKLRARRLLLRMSQSELAHASGVTFQQIQKYERGSNRVSASRLHTLAGAMHTPVAHFFEGIAPSATATRAPATSELVEKSLATPEGRELALLFATIPSLKVRKRVVDLARAVVEVAWPPPPSE